MALRRTWRRLSVALDPVARLRGDIATLLASVPESRKPAVENQLRLLDQQAAFYHGETAAIIKNARQRLGLLVQDVPEVGAIVDKMDAGAYGEIK
jgi:hypothetical protein